MTDRKPDVLPVEGASIESLSVDALVSLIEDRLDYYYPEAIEALGALKRRAAAQVAPPRPLDKERASVAEGLEALDYLTLHTNANGFADGACALATLRLELERAAAEGEALRADLAKHTARRFPMLQPVKGGLRSIPWALIAPQEGQARDNHGQTLERLAERGGLGAIEAIAVLRGVEYRVVRGMTEEAASSELRELVAKFESALPAPPKGST
jgi:hypothetical protein